MKIKFKIKITEEYNLNISIINQQEIELFIEDVIPCISFNENTIKICEEYKQAIHFIQKWFENPEEYVTYPILFQNKNFDLLPEVLFAIIINDFKKKIEKEYIIENTEIELPTDNSTILQRIKISLQAINLKGIEITENEEISYDYSLQGEMLQELLVKKQIIDEYNKMLNNAKVIYPEANDKLENIQSKIYSEETFYQAMISHFTTQERSKMKLCKLDNYCLFISSRYFESVNDHINFIQVTKKLKLNLIYKHQFFLNFFSFFPPLIL